MHKKRPLIAAAAAVIALATAFVVPSIASAAEPVPPITSTVAWQSVSTITDNSGVIASYSETKNETGTNGYTFDGVASNATNGTAIRFHVGQQITLSTDFKVNTAASWWWLGTYNYIDSIGFNPYAQLNNQNWSAPSCSQPTGIYQGNSGILDFTCTSTMTIPTNAPPSYNTTTNVRSTFGVPTFNMNNAFTNNPLYANPTAIQNSGSNGTLIQQSFTPRWDYVAASTSLVAAPKNYSMLVGQHLTITPAMLIAGVTDSSGAPADADGVVVSTVPTGATVATDQTIDYTATHTGNFQFTFAVSNSESNVTSPVADGGITATSTGTPSIPTITVQPFTAETTVGTPLVITTANLAAGAMLSDGSTGAIDNSDITVLPTGGSIDPDNDNALNFPADTVGTFTFTFTLTRNSDGATSAPQTGTITVDPANQIIGVPQVFNLVVGDSVTFTSDELSVGATNSTDGSAVGSDIVIFSPPIPAGGTVNELANGESMDFAGTTPGTYSFSYVISYLAKTSDASGVITSVINVTAKPVAPAPPVVKPIVTG